jgi:hypothetical protein
MTSLATPEVWLRGPLPGVPAALQPVGHALLQAREELHALIDDFPPSQLWIRPVGVASPGFHLQHMRGVLDRLFTYARGEPLTADQLRTLAAEGTPGDDPPSPEELVAAFDAQVDRAVAQLRATDPATLGDVRAVGRAQLPSTVIGLLVHAAEHVQRHLGQLLVTARVARTADPAPDERLAF